MEEILEFIKANEQSSSVDLYQNPFMQEKAVASKGMFAVGPNGPIYEFLKEQWNKNGDQLSV